MLCGAFVAGGVVARAMPQSGANLRPCRVVGRVASGESLLPGAVVTLLRDDKALGATSTDAAGEYAVSLAPGSYRVRVELTAFAPFERDITVAGPPCDLQVDAALRLASRTPGAPPVPTTVSAGPAPAAGAAPAGGGRGRGGRLGGAAQRFEALTVQQAAAGDTSDAAVMASVAGADDPASSLLPAGFSVDTPLESITVSGTMVDVDRGLMNDRMQAIARGEFGPGDAEQPAQLAQAPGAALAGAGGAAGEAGRGGRAGGAPGGGRGGLAGRVGGAGRVQMSANYGMSGSLLNAAPYPLRNEARPERDYLQQNYSMTLGGPLRIPGLYANASNRTTFNVSYTGTSNGDLFDQYATVPSADFRRGDFSSSPVPIVDPLTGQPFTDNRIPDERISQAARTLLRFVPEPTLPGDTRNFRQTATTRSTSNSVSVRITQVLVAPPARGRGAGAARAGGAGRAGGAAAPATGSAPRGRGAPVPVFTATVNGTFNYRRNEGDRLNVFPLLTGGTRGSTISAPIALNMRYGRSVHNVTTNFSQTRSRTLSDFAFTENVVGLAGIGGVSADPFDWGVPTISFSSGFTALRDITPSDRLDRSLQIGYGWTRPSGTHTYRVGGNYSRQSNDSLSNANARGSFTFTGLYTAGGLSVRRGSGQDFADFLLGLPQQATRQFSGSADAIANPIAIRGWQGSLYFQDDWRWKARWTINYGVQYEYISPFREANGRMVNLDANADFSAVAPVLSGEVGLYTGVFPIGLVLPDSNNIAPRIGVAWRATNRSVVRFGYGLTYNSGTYSTIARQLYQQPPFFLTGTSLGSISSPLSLFDPFAAISPNTVTNNYGIDKNYVAGLVHQWSADYSRDLSRMWAMGATYVGTRGMHLDMLRAPNRGPDGLRIDDVQAFTWQTSEGSSYANALSLRLQKRQSRGVSGNVSYTFGHSRDNTTATGGGVTVAQDDRNLDAEWGPSNFDRRHQLTGLLSVELPWGVNRRWLNNGGWLASLAGDWSLSANVSWNSGTPLTVRCSSCASDVARGIGGTLRADYSGAPIDVADPAIDHWFNTAAFTLPEPGAFGNSPRNLIVGPGSKQLNATFSRDLRLGGNRGVTIQLSATNLLNTVNYGGVDTNVNSSTFGQVTSVRGMRAMRLNVRLRF